MPIETYQQALDFWHSRVNYEQRGMPADLRELKLDRMRELLDRLGKPDARSRIVHIAGSKGKGSTAAMLASVLQRAGHRVGLFTSPHLSRVEERVQVNGQLIPPEELLTLMREIEPAVAEVERNQQSPPTFFEIVTALGLLHFARRRVQLAVLEVGLGGRFDATNVCNPLVSVITSISFDHTEQLGNTLADIAREKAGIIKPRRPTISGVTDSEARNVIEEIALARRSPLCTLGRDYDFTSEPGFVTADTCRAPVVTVRTRSGTWPGLDLKLLGQHQAANAAVVVACVEELRGQGVHIPEVAVRAGLREVYWPARMEVVRRRPLVILDCAHNVASIQALIETLHTSFPPSRRAVIFAGSRDKDLAGMLALLNAHFQRTYLTRYSSSARGAPVEELAELWQRLGGGPHEVHALPMTAWEAARSWAGADDLICITGSVFLAGELREVM